MACCLTGHVSDVPLTAHTAVTTAPACHTIVEAQTSDRVPHTPEKFCSSCDDCVVLSASTADADLSAIALSDLKFVALINRSSALPRAEVRLLRSTGPPLKQDARLNDSPLSRADILII
jgi:hypothetical protein